MSITTEEFDSFADFGRSLLLSGNDAMSLDDLVMEWESRQNRAEINEAIREGLADADAGRHRPAEQVIVDLRQKHGLSAK